jgi:hypothetical protein
MELEGSNWCIMRTARNQLTIVWVNGEVLNVTAGGTVHIKVSNISFCMLKACLRVLVGNASSLSSVCPCVPVKEFNTVVYLGCGVVVVIGKVPTENP